MACYWFLAMRSHGLAALAMTAMTSSGALGGELVFTGELLSARTGAPVADANLTVEVLSRAGHAFPVGCADVYLFDRFLRPGYVAEKKERTSPVPSEARGPGRFVVRIKSSSGFCAYQPINLRLTLGHDRRIFRDQGVVYVVNDNGTLNLQRRPWALLAPDNREELAAFLADVHNPVRPGTHIVLAYLEPHYREVVSTVVGARDSRAARFYSQEEAIRSAYWELLFQRRGDMDYSTPHDHLPPVEILARDGRFLAWTTPVGWRRFEVGRHHIDDYAGVTDPWAFLIEGRIRREGDVWKMELATPPVTMPPNGPPRYAIAMPLRPEEIDMWQRRTVEQALGEQARRELVQAHLVESHPYDDPPTRVENPQLGELPNVAVRATLDGGVVTVRIANVERDYTSAITAQFDYSVTQGRVVLDRPRVIAYENWNPSDADWGDRICKDRGPTGEPRGLGWMTGYIDSHHGERADVTRCDPMAQGGCRLGMVDRRTWFGRCWWDASAHDELLGPKPLPIRRVRYWTAPAGPEN